MTWTLFGPLSNATGAELDGNFANVALLGAYPSAAVGTNSITLTPTINAPAITAYQNYQGFTFVVPTNTTGAVTVRVGALAVLPLYWPSGTQVGSGDLTAGQLCLIAYNAALNSNNGGFVVLSPTQPIVFPSAGQLHSQLFTATGANTFAIPAGAKSTTPFIFTLGGGGGAGGGATTASGAVGGGGSSGAIIRVAYSGFAAGQNVTITLGVAGAASTLAYAAVTIGTAQGGNAGAAGSAVSTVVLGGAAPTGSSASAGASGLTLLSSTVPGFAVNGGLGIALAISSGSGEGGSAWPFGIGGPSSSSTGAGANATGYSAGGAGGVRGGSDVAGGTGAPGACLVEWVL